MAGLRKRKSPLVRSVRPCVRAKFEAVEMPLKRTKKSQNALKKPLLFSEDMGKNLADLTYSTCKFTLFEDRKTIFDP